MKLEFQYSIELQLLTIEYYSVNYYGMLPLQHYSNNFQLTT